MRVMKNTMYYIAKTYNQKRIYKKNKKVTNNYENHSIKRVINCSLSNSNYWLFKNRMIKEFQNLQKKQRV